MFFNSPFLYYIPIVLQVICAVHCIRKGNQYNWLWLIIFLPLLGSIIYMFVEMFSGNDIQQMQNGMGAVFNPSGKIKKLEENLRFADTFNNKVALADALLAAGQTEKAIALYESCLTGTFTVHDHVNMQLIYAYDAVNRYADIISLAKKIYSIPQFTRSRAHMVYAMALSKAGNAAAAEAEFKMLNGRFSNYESRYQFGCFLIRESRQADARKLFEEILNEASHLEGKEKRDNRIWFAQVKDELKKISAG